MFCRARRSSSMRAGKGQEATKGTKALEVKSGSVANGDAGGVKANLHLRLIAVQDGAAQASVKFFEETETAEPHHKPTAFDMQAMTRECELDDGHVHGSKCDSSGDFASAELTMSVESRG